jgi:hypothetical protein
MGNDFNDKFLAIGALWANIEMPDDMELVGGQVLKIVVFRSNKKQPKQPDYKIYIEKAQAQQEPQPEPISASDEDSQIPF